MDRGRFLPAPLPLCVALPALWVRLQRKVHVCVFQHASEREFFTEPPFMSHRLCTDNTGCLHRWSKIQRQAREARRGGGATTPCREAALARPDWKESLGAHQMPPQRLGMNPSPASAQMQTSESLLDSNLCVTKRKGSRGPGPAAQELLTFHCSASAQ